MAEFVMVMKGSAPGGDWDTYIRKLIDSGKFRGGSSLGNGACVSKDRTDRECSVTGYIRLTVEDLDEAKMLLAGNPVYESGGNIELLEEVQD
jgi:hypothetical protein